MPCYQVLTALRPATRGHLEKLVGDAVKTIVKDGGVVRRVHKTDEIRFPFTFKGKGVGEKYTRGNWVTIDMISSVDAMRLVESQLRVHDDVLRFTTRKTADTLI
jgi:ribosomal protein S6